MLMMEIVLDGDNAWPELKGTRFLHVGQNPADPPMQVALLDKGLNSGRPSVAIRVDFKDHYGIKQTLIAETSARLFCTAARAFWAKHPDLFEGGV